MITIYHNPRCSKSREALAIAEGFSKENSVPLKIVDYIKNPLSSEQLKALQQALGTALGEMIRDNEPEYRALDLAGADDASLLKALADHPGLLQRPIVTYCGRAAIGRPPERVNDLLRIG
jgi:arsenate reductase